MECDLDNRTIQHLTEPGQARNAPPANACPLPGAAPFGVPLKEHAHVHPPNPP
jgi:hypothetical protein